MAIRKQEAESNVDLDTVMWSSKVLDTEEDASLSWFGTSLFRFYSKKRSMDYTNEHQMQNITRQPT